MALLQCQHAGRSASRTHQAHLAERIAGAEKRQDDLGAVNLVDVDLDRALQEQIDDLTRLRHRDDVGAGRKDLPVKIFVEAGQLVFGQPFEQRQLGKDFQVLNCGHAALSPRFVNRRRDCISGRPALIKI